MTSCLRAESSIVEFPRRAMARGGNDGRVRGFAGDGQIKVCSDVEVRESVISDTFDAVAISTKDAVDTCVEVSALSGQPPPSWQAASSAQTVDELPQPGVW